MSPPGKPKVGGGSKKIFASGASEIVPPPSQPLRRPCNSSSIYHSCQTDVCYQISLHWI